MSSSSQPTTNEAQPLIQRGNDLAITINDLSAPGTQTVFNCRVSPDGNVELRYVGKLKAAGLSTAQFEGVIVKAFRDAQLMDMAQVSVKEVNR